MKLFPFIGDCFPWSMAFNLLGIGNLFEIIGCQNTPAKGSRYCSQHCATAMTFRDDICPCHKAAILPGDQKSFVLPRKASSPWFPLQGLAW